MCRCLICCLLFIRAQNLRSCMLTRIYVSSRDANSFCLSQLRHQAVFKNYYHYITGNKTKAMGRFFLASNAWCLFRCQFSNPLTLTECPAIRFSPDSNHPAFTSDSTDGETRFHQTAFTSGASHTH